MDDRFDVGRLVAALEDLGTELGHDAARTLTVLQAAAEAKVQNLRDRDLVALHMPPNVDIDYAEAFSAACGVWLDDLRSRGCNVEMLVLENDTNLAEVNDVVMAQAGWVRATS